ncbi:MAG: YCF48-related protein, partial [Bryobacteraceae bacterium]
ILRVYFLNENRGFAIGPRKTILETSDGGKSWSALKVVEKVPTSTANTVFTAIDFLAGRFGIIAGWSRPPQRNAYRLPEWMDPESALKRRELPASTVVLETRDSGSNWNSQVTSMFGRISLLRISRAASALSVFEFDDSFEYASEVFRVDLRTGKSWRVFREKDRMATDVYEDGEGTAYIAAIECAGKLRRSPIPGKLKIFSSGDLKSWHVMPVDYRAVAHQAILAAAGPAHIWAATDTGMILKLER